MKSKGFWGMVLIAILAIAANSAFAQRGREVHFRGTISDYTPQSPVAGPWEVRGQWSLTINRNGKADFSAAVNMGRSDLGVMNSGGGDLNNPADRNAHTHHITLTNGKVTFPSPGTIEVSGGTVTITANGAWPPPFGSTASLVIDISGGTGPNSVTFSNIKVTFGDDAEKHFGPNPINGVVRSVRWY
jgi:type 1 fimbria pilin